MEQTEAMLEQIYTAESPNSQEQFNRDRKSMPGGAKGAYFYPPYPLTMQRGEGCYLYDLDERRLVDFANHHTGQILGHNNPAVNQAVQAQLSRGIALGAPMGNEVELAEEICDRVTSIERIRFCNSGTEATLHAIRLARGFCGCSKIAKFEGGYHGSHDIVEVSVAPQLEKAGPAEAPNSVPTAGGISPHAPAEVIVLPYNNEDAVEQLVRRHRHELACVLLDPKTGILPLRKEFVQAVRRVTQENDVLLILDEVVGFRIARGGVQEYYDIAPDLTTFGKLVGGGFPRRCLWRPRRYNGPARYQPRANRIFPEWHLQCPCYGHGSRARYATATASSRLCPSERTGRTSAGRLQRSFRPD